MFSKDVAYLDQDTLFWYSKVYGIWQEKKLPVVILRTACSWDVQTAILAQGRKRLSVVNEYRMLAGLAPLPASDPNNIVSWTVTSKHILPLDPKKPQKVCAFDIGLLDPDGRITYDLKADVNKDQVPDYKQLGATWKDLNPRCRWGGDYGDYGHFEFN